MLLTLSWLVPLAGALCMLLIGNSDGRRDGLIRWLALGVALATLAVTVGLWVGFDAASADFQFVERHPWIPQFGIDYFVGVDGISLLLVVLTGFLTPIALLSSWGSIDRKVKEFSIFMLALEAAMIGVFISLDLFLFYVFWDAMLIPMYFLIGIWGYDRRIYAAIKFMLYTMAGSVLMLIAILGLAYLHSAATGTYTFDLLKLLSLDIAPQTQTWFFLAFTVAFAIKVPFCSHWGPFNEVGVAVSCTYKGEPAYFLTCLFLSSSDAIAPGREIWGCPKKLADITAEQYGAEFTTTAVRAGVPFMRLNSRCIAPAKAEEVPPLWPMYLLKIIPRCDSAEPAIKQLTLNGEVDNVVTHKLFKGPGVVKFEPTVSGDFWRLEPKEFLGAFYQELDFTQGPGRVVHDYLVK